MKKKIIRPNATRGRFQSRNLRLLAETVTALVTVLRAISTSISCPLSARMGTVTGTGKVRLKVSTELRPRHFCLCISPRVPGANLDVRNRHRLTPPCRLVSTVETMTECQPPLLFEAQSNCDGLPLGHCRRPRSSDRRPLSTTRSAVKAMARVPCR